MKTGDEGLENTVGYWICFDCGEKLGKSRSLCFTVHEDTCDYCLEFKPVTSARKFGYPKLEVKNENNLGDF